MRDPEAEREFLPDPSILTTDFGAIARDAEIRLVAEVMGGIEPTGGYVLDLLRSGRVVELSLDHDLGDDERHGRGTAVVDFIAEEQELRGRKLWPRDGIRLHTGNAYGRDAMRRTIRRYCERGGIEFHESLSPGGKPVFRFRT